jgi:type IV pilus assembly protein PilW
MPRSWHAGMTLIELLVAMAIGVGVVMVLSTLLFAVENHKRTTTSTNDADQAGAYTFHALDKALRSAGSAIIESTYAGAGVLGCRLNAAAILPAASLPPPFSTAFLGGAPSNLRVAPLVIGPAQSADGQSDVIMVMSGSGSAGGVSRQITGSGSSTSLVLDNTIGFATSDLVLVSQNNITDCLLEEVSANPLTTSPNLTLGSTTYYTSNSGTASLSTLAGSTSTYVTPLGNAVVNNLQMLIGVDTKDTLYSYDLLQNVSLVQSPGSTDVATPISDGVYRMHAIYGVDTNGNGTWDAWASPTDTNYDPTTVMTTAGTQQKIISVRVSLLVRGEYYDKNVVSPASFTMFSGLTNAGGASVAQPVNLSNNDQHYRYRLFEFTVPLRNMILLAGGP